MTTTTSKHNVHALTEELIEKGQRYYVPSYKPREMILDHGVGSKVWDLDGNDYIDLGSGIAVNSLGHQHPALVDVLEQQIHKLWHTSNIFYTEPTVRLAQELVESSNFAKRVFFCNSGAEANEAAIKLARKYAANQGRSPEEREIVTFKGSFHGRTLATVTATAQPKYQEGFEPLPGGFVYAEAYNDEEAVDKSVSDKTCAILVEPVQGEGGIVPAKPGFLSFLRKKCDDVGALLMFDQVQCGMMRTGKLFSHWHEEGVQPDTVSLAKALGCGIPIGAMLAGEKVADVLQFGSHGTTFGGSPLACSVALAALRILKSDEIEQNVAERSKQIFDALEAMNTRHDCFTELRGRGLMVGAELKPEWHGKAGDISEMSRKAGALVLIAGPNVMRFLPPLNITEDDLAEGLNRFETALEAFLNGKDIDRDAQGLFRRMTSKLFGS